MEIVIDFSVIPTNDPVSFGWWFIKTIGWIFPVFLFVYGILISWQNWLRANFRKTRKYILLAVDVPKDNETGPKAVENIFNQLAGAQSGVGFYEKWWTGEMPESFSFEIISMEGYIQFIIHLPANFRDLVEAIIYAQYPNAEIMEIEDYTKDWDLKFPNDKYELWGTELKLAKKEFFPIRTYPEFEHIVEGYKDSMAGLLEAINRIGPGQHIWIQMVVTPADSSWTEASKPAVQKIVGVPSEPKKDIMDSITSFAGSAVDAVFSSPTTKDSGGSKKEPSKMPYLTQGEKDIALAIEKKVAKLGFYTKIRIIYLAEKEVANKPIVKAVLGGFKQFNTSNLNAFKTDGKKTTGSMVWFAKKRMPDRQRKILKAYKNRGFLLEPGNYGFVLNSEELASIYHFPTLGVKTPSIKKAEAKKAEPPISLPVMTPKLMVTKADSSKKAVTAEPPSNLPI